MTTFTIAHDGLRPVRERARSTGLLNDDIPLARDRAIADCGTTPSTTSRPRR